VTGKDCQLFNYRIGISYQKTMADKLISLLLPMVAGSCLAVPIMVALLLWVLPCTPPFIGSMMPFCRTEITESREELLPTLGFRIAVLLFEVLNFYMVCCQGGFYLIFVFFTGVVCLTNYLQVLEK
jgi:hypothetical protein